jgi:FkbM family methyltransferase
MMSSLKALIVGPMMSYIHAQKCKAKSEQEIRCLPVLCDRNRDSLDIGANGGNFAYFILKHSRSVHAFEPIAALVGHLRRRFPSRVTVYHMALSSQSGVAELSIPVVDGHKLFGLSSLDFNGGDGTEQFAQEQVPLRRLDDVFDGDAGFIKIDVEGHEIPMLEGAKQTISRCRPAMLVEASERQYPGSVGQLKSALEELGYDGWFAQGGEIHALAGYAPSSRKDISLAQLADRHYLATHEKYVSNFICLPKERTVEFLPRLKAALVHTSR